MTTYYLNSPLKDGDVTKLKIGDIIYISGDSFTCRSRLQRYIFDEQNELPFSTENRNILIHTGPIILKENDSFKLISFMPTSSIRFEKWGARSIEEWDLKLICGKTTMGKKTSEMMRRKKCVHISPNCVSPNLWIDSITIENVYLFNELGSIEAPWLIKLDKLGPFVVDMDCEGNNLYDNMDLNIQAKKEEQFRRLLIPDDFEYTKLY